MLPLVGHQQFGSTARSRNMFHRTLTRPRRLTMPTPFYLSLFQGNDGQPGLSGPPGAPGEKVRLHSLHFKSIQDLIIPTVSLLYHAWRPLACGSMRLLRLRVNSGHNSWFASDLCLFCCCLSFVVARVKRDSRVSRGPLVFLG